MFEIRETAIGTDGSGCVLLGALPRWLVGSERAAITESKRGHKSDIRRSHSPDTDAAVFDVP